MRFEIPRTVLLTYTNLDVRWRTSESWEVSGWRGIGRRPCCFSHFKVCNQSPTTARTLQRGPTRTGSPEGQAQCHLRCSRQACAQTVPMQWVASFIYQKILFSRILWPVPVGETANTLSRFGHSSDERRFSYC